MKLDKKITMVGDNILVYINLPKTKTESGIVISEDTATALQKDITGEIIAIGPDVKNFYEGDEVLLPPNGNIPVSLGEEVFHVFKEYSLFAKVG